MVVVDNYPRWIEILHHSDMTSAACTAKLKDIFARCGIPTELVCDNSAQFSSSEFTSFAEQYGFTPHVTSSWNLPKAAQAVQTAKRIIKKGDPWLSLFVYRDTVIAAT